MILSTQVIQNKNDSDDSSSEENIKDEGLNELKNIIKTNEESKPHKVSIIGKKPKNKNNSNGDESSYNLSKIEFKSQSINSSLRSLSRGEDFIQKDILQALNGLSIVSLYFILLIIFYIQKKNESIAVKQSENQIIETLSEHSFQSRGKNFILKSDYLNNTNNSKRNSNNQDSSNNNEKTLKEGSEKNKSKNISNHISAKELNINLLNNNIFKENKIKNKDDNIIKGYNQNLKDDTSDLKNNEFDNINIQENEINKNNKINYNKNNNYINEMNHNNKIINENIIINSTQINPINQKENQTLTINEKEEEKIFSQNPINEDMNKNKSQLNPFINQIEPYIVKPSQLSMNQILNLNNNNILNNHDNYQNKNIYNFPSNNNNIYISDKREEYLIINCMSLYKEQIECRQLQSIIDSNPALASNLIYPKIKYKIQEISFDQFGNYLIQKVIEYLNMDQIQEILFNKISHNFRSFCFNQHGTRVVQKILEKIADNDYLLNYFNNLLEPNLKDFAIDQIASHLIMKYVNILQSPKNDFVVNFLVENSLELAMKKYSCCVLQKCIEYSNEKQKKKFLMEIAVKSFCLFNDQYGNYVVQYCINLCDYEINKIFVENFLYNIIQFSTQKYSSNIIEKCMECCDEKTKEMICQKYYDKDIVEKLLFDMYGNFVLQKVINISKEPLTSKYLEMIGPLLKNLVNYSFGQKIYNKLISSFPSLKMYVGISNKPFRNKKFKNKKNKYNEMEEGYFQNNIIKNQNPHGINNLNVEEFVNSNNIYVNNSYNINNVNNNINKQNNNNGQLLMMPGVNNYLIPFKLNDNINNTNHINQNNILFQNKLNNNDFIINNSNINNNNFNNFYNLLQHQQSMNRNIEMSNNNYYNNNYNNQ